MRPSGEEIEDEWDPQKIGELIDEPDKARRTQAYERREEVTATVYCGHCNTRRAIARVFNTPFGPLYRAEGDIASEPNAAAALADSRRFLSEQFGIDRTPGAKIVISEHLADWDGPLERLPAECRKHGRLFVDIDLSVGEKHHNAHTSD